MTDEPLVIREERGPVTILTMVYKPLNLIGPKLGGALVEKLEIAKDAGARAIVIRSGLKHFSAGADLLSFAGGPPAGNDTLKFLDAFESLPIPIIASIHGACLGGGFELALLCDYIIAGQSAQIGSVESQLGLNPLAGAVQRQTARAGALRAKEISMLGRRYDPATLERWNLINQVVADDELEARTLEIATEFGNGPTVAHAATKALANIAERRGVAAADEAMAELQQPIWTSEDLRTGFMSFQANGPGKANFQGR
jgi:enoyl-CoA hydratase/carnithine racemase